MTEILHWIFPPAVEGRGAVALLLLRLFVGIAIARHGYGKAVGVRAFAEEFGIPLPLAWGASLVQLLGGAAIAVGFLTPLAALGVGSTMLVATETNIRAGDPMISPHGHSWESSGFYLVSCVVLSLMGAGLLSLDALLFR